MPTLVTRAVGAALALGLALAGTGCLADGEELDEYFECGACDAFGDDGGPAVDTVRPISGIGLVRCRVEEDHSQGDPLYDQALLKCEVFAGLAPATVASLEVTGTYGEQGVVSTVLQYPQPGEVTVHAASLQLAYPMRLTLRARIELASVLGLDRSITVEDELDVNGPTTASTTLVFPLELWGIELVGSAEMAPYRAFSFQAQYFVPDPIAAELAPQATIRAGQSGRFYLVVDPGGESVVAQGRLFGGRGAEDLTFAVPIAGPGVLVVAADGIARAQ